MRRDSFSLVVLLHADDLYLLVDEAGHLATQPARSLPPVASVDVREAQAGWREVVIECEGGVDEFLGGGSGILENVLEACSHTWIAEVCTRAYGTVISSSDLSESPIRDLAGSPVNPLVSACFTPISALSWPVESEMGQSASDLSRMLATGEQVDVAMRVRSVDEISVAGLVMVDQLSNSGRLANLLG